MTNADFNDLETRDYIFKIGSREKGMQARYDENTDALIFPRAVFDYVYELLKEALSQEPTDENLHREREQAYMQGYEDASKRFRQEPCDDVVSRQDALNCLNGAWGDYSVLNEVYERISKLPSVTQKPGKWIDREVYDADRWKCSACGRTKPYREDYCPNCGAKMEVRSRNDSNKRNDNE